MKQYVTTAIDFPNAIPHMGHVMEKILADVLVRWMRLRGDEVKFHLGTDENGIKIQQTAKEMGITPRELVDRNAPIFKETFQKFHVSFDYFIRTADPVSHWPTVTALWERIKKAGKLEKRSYSGLYCNGCEKFVNERDLVDGKCPDHNQVPQSVTEANWFFLLKGMEPLLEKLLKEGAEGGYRMIPSWRGNEVRAFLVSGLEDVSFSRSKETLSWGVPVPGDDSQVMYVWCDNLTSYISSLGLLTDHAQNEWWDGATVTHVIGKDIARFHALNWPAMLTCAVVKTPDQLLIHGFITHEGQKMSKTLGNVVDPLEVLSHFGGDPDPLRFFFSHEIPIGNDGDFSWKRIDETYDAVLRNKLGNLLNRVVVMLKREGGAVQVPSAGEFMRAIEPAVERYRTAMESMEFSTALQEVVRMMETGNEYMNVQEPWKKQGEDRVRILSEIAELLRIIALLLLPFIPRTAQRMSEQLGVPYAAEMLNKDFVLKNNQRDLVKWGALGSTWTKIGEPEILFAPLE